MDGWMDGSSHSQAFKSLVHSTDDAVYVKLGSAQKPIQPCIILRFNLQLDISNWFGFFSTEKVG